MEFPSMSHDTILPTELVALTSTPCGREGPSLHKCPKRIRHTSSLNPQVSMDVNGAVSHLQMILFWVMSTSALT